MKPPKRVVPLTVILLSFCLPAFAATYYVPDDFSTIQAALDGAVDYDTILVRDGTYTGAENKNLDLGGKAVTLQSINGPDHCIIDCQGNGRGFIFQSAETSASIIQGLTITNGRVPGNGGGIYISNASPAIINCVISYCTATELPPAIPGALDNDDIGNGGGIYLEASSSTLNRCVIKNNASASDGGGIYCTDSSINIVNCNIVGNSTPEDGGGIEVHSYSSATLVNCTIADNSCAERGGGIDAINGSDVVVVNSILWGNSGTGSQIGIAGWNEPSSVTVSYSDVEGGQAGVYVETVWCPSCTLSWGSGNINEDPQFAGENDYHLAATSPCIDAGSSNVGVHEDIDLEVRPLLNGYDIGSDEFSEPPALTVIYLSSPSNKAILSSPPTFRWLADGGADNGYAVDLSYSSDFTRYWSTYNNLHIIISEKSWTMPLNVWKGIQLNRGVHWRVRGVDQSIQPRTIITSGHWGFYKQ